MRFLRVLALTSLSLLAVGCPPKVEPPKDVPPPPPPPPTVKLQVISIDPARVDAMQPFRAELFGSGFEDGGMKVRVGVMMVASLNVLDGNTIEINVPPMPDGVYDITVDAPDGRSHTLRSGLVVRAKPPPPDPTAGLGCEDITINFDFNSARLSDGAMRTLEGKLACFTDRTGTVRIEGHCDERGTTNYNLALGQRRADSVSRWLAAQGVPASRISAVSFGEERPVDSRNSESAWAKNRRGEISSSN